VNNGENGDGREADKDRWLDSTPVKCFWFSIPVLLLIGFGFLVWQRYRNRKTTYRGSPWLLWLWPSSYIQAQQFYPT